LNPFASFLALRSFEAAARLSSFQQAANELNLTSSAISHQIKRLEDELGQKLFVRMQRKVYLTPSGETLYASVSGAFLEISRGLRAINADVDPAELRVSAAPLFAATYLTSCIGQFERENPTLRLNLDVSQNIVDLESENFDVAIRYSLEPPNSRIFSEILIPVRAALICAPSIAVKIKGIDDIKQFTRIVLSQAADDWVFWYAMFGRADTAQARQVQFRPMMDAVQATIDGIGVMVAPIQMVQKYLNDGRLVAPFDKSMELKAAYLRLCRKGDERLPRILKFRNWIRRQCSGEQPVVLTRASGDL